MRQSLLALLAFSFAVSAVATAAPTVPSAATPAPLDLKKIPVIVRIVSRPLCSALRTNVGPAIEKLLQNDHAIAASPPLLQEYNLALGEGAQGSGRRQIVLLRTENLVDPLSNSLLAIKRLLADPRIFPLHPATADQARLLKLKKRLDAAIAGQEVSLDIINGFVTTQQLGDMQHNGFGYIKAISGSEMTNNGGLPSATPNPLYVNSKQAGLQQTPGSPTFIDPATIPGLTLGYNPISHLVSALKWTQAYTAKHEHAVATSVMSAVHDCAPPPAKSAPNPAASP